MNWQQIHQILTKMTAQRTIPKLNSVGIEASRKVLANNSYRIYVNHSFKSEESLSVAISHQHTNVTDDEKELASVLGKSSWGYDCAFERGNQCFYIVSTQNQCFCMVAVPNKDEFTVKQREILRTLVSVWGQLLATLYYYQRDALTGLLNRNILLETINGSGFDLGLFDDESSAQRQQERRDFISLPESHAVALIDIDNFKAVNDTWGHTIGDEVLIKLSQLMQVTFRECDVICRYGGEEFAVYLRYVGRNKAEEILTRFCQRVRESVFPKVETITVSIGFTITFPGVLASELIERADAALYYAKNNGKDRVIAAEDHENLWTSTASFDIGEIELF